MCGWRRSSRRGDAAPRTHCQSGTEFGPYMRGKVEEYRRAHHAGVDHVSGASMWASSLRSAGDGPGWPIAASAARN